MTKPVLLIMAAGLGSRYGGLKQIDPVDGDGHLLIDYSLYDAYKAGFETVIFIVSDSNENDFRDTIGKRVSSKMNVHYAIQRLEDLPCGFAVPDGRVKPWGTAHAVLSARKLVRSPFAVINADDFYGAAAFKSIYDFLANSSNKNCHAMVGYNIENTLTDYGFVSRGVCKIDNGGSVVEIVERTHIETRPGGAEYTEDGGKSYTFLPAGTIVSMNIWGFQECMMVEVENRFADFLSVNLPKNAQKCEYFMTYIINALLHEGGTVIKALPSKNKWFGVTYSEDMMVVKSAISHMREDGSYPAELWNH